VEERNHKVAHAVEEFLTQKQTSVSPETLRGYRNLLEKHILPQLGGYKLTQLSEGVLQDHFNSLAAPGGGPQLSPNTLRHIKAALKGVIRLSIRRRWMFKDPLEFVELRKKPSRKAMNVLSTEQVDLLLKATSEDRFHALWAILLSTGMRPQEAMALKWEDFDSAPGGGLGPQVTIQRAFKSWDYGSDRTRVEEVGKTEASFATITVPPSVLEALKVHRRRQAEISEWVFRFASIQVVRKAWYRTLEKLGLPKVRLYDTRHTHATELLKAGVHMKVIQERLRHTNINTTMDVYSHVTPEMDQQAAEVFDSLRRSGNTN
jgi:integrase